MPSTGPAALGTMGRQCYDVVVVGSGMVGSALAALLGSNAWTRNLRIAVVDGQAQSLDIKLKPSPDMRVSTITPASMRSLQEAGAWPAIERHAAMFSQMQVWDADAAQSCIRWDAKDLQVEHMGCVVENSVLQAALLSAARSSAAESIDMIWPASVAAIGLPGHQRHQQAPNQGPQVLTDARGPSDLAWLQLEDGRRLWTRLIVAADGGNSRVRSLADLRTRGEDYHQRALVATVRTSDPMDRTAWQRFLPLGPFALLPVRDGFHNIVWSTSHEAARNLEQLSPLEFAAAANNALHGALPELQKRGTAPGSGALPESTLRSGLPAGAADFLSRLEGNPFGPSLEALMPQHRRPRVPPQIEAWVGSAPRSFPLQLRQAGKYVLPRLALVGDAAHTVHPLAGQGVNLGIADAYTLSKAIASACECGSDIGDVMMLKENYESPRQAGNQAMIVALDLIRDMFAHQAPPVPALRALGLNLINMASPIRNSIMRFAMGF